MGDTGLLRGKGSKVNIVQFVEDIAALTLYDSGSACYSSDEIAQANEAIRVRCLDEISRLQEGLALSTVASYLAGYRKAIDARFEGQKVYNLGVYNGRYKCHLAKAFMVLDASDLKRLRSEQAVGLETKLQASIRVSDAAGYIQRAHELMQSAYWHDLAVGLLAVTGRRVTEVYKTASFSKCLSKWEIGTNIMMPHYSVLFSGQLKKRYGEEEAYPIPVLASPDLVIDALRRLREQCDYRDVAVSVVNSRVSTNASKFVRKHYGEFVENRLVAKSCRDIYVVMAMGLCTDYKTVKMLGFFAQHVLGHGGTGAALNYMPALLKKEGYEALRSYMQDIWKLN